MQTSSWLNISQSIDATFRSLLTTHGGATLPIFRGAFPPDAAQRRALVGATALDRAVFFQIVPGDLDVWQETYTTIWLAQRNPGQQHYTPVGNTPGLWQAELTAKLQFELDQWASNRRLMPLYDYVALIPEATYATFLASGDPAPLAAYLTGTPESVPGTGFVIQGGHAQPALTDAGDPTVFEWTLIWRHWNYEVYQGMRGV